MGSVYTAVPGQTMTRPVGLAVRLSPQELALFHAVAAARETTLSELIRTAVAAESAGRFSSGLIKNA